MNKMRSSLNLLAAFAVCVLCSSLAQAQASRTWVSGVGDDVNPCSRTAPCKTFAGAISKTAASGEISVLDPGGFGAVTITKAITIDGDGTLAGILSAGTNAIIVNAGANDVVTIRSISINGAGSGINGIRFLAGKQLNVENCTIAGFTSRGIDVSTTAAAGKLTVKNTTITGLSGTGTSEEGIVVAGSGAGSGDEVSLDHVRLQGMNTGLDVRDSGGGVTPNKVTISNSVVTHNFGNGVIAFGNAIINVESTVVAHNNVGINAANAGSNVRLSRSSILNNSTGIVIAAGATVTTFQNNVIFGNTATTAPNDVKSQQ